MKAEEARAALYAERDQLIAEQLRTWARPPVPQNFLDLVQQHQYARGAHAHAHARGSTGGVEATVRPSSRRSPLNAQPSVSGRAPGPPQQCRPRTQARPP